MNVNPLVSDTVVRRPLLTVNGVCAALSVSRPTVYRLIADGELVGIRIRGHLRFAEVELDEFIDRHRDKPR